MNSPRPNRQTLHVALGLILGIFIGEGLNLALAPSGADSPPLSAIMEVCRILTDIFLRLVKMIIAPLVFSTLVVGIARMGDAHAVGRIGLKAILWFFTVSLISLLLGMLLANALQPGVGLQMPLPGGQEAADLPTVKPSLAGFTEHVFPKSIIEAMANNEILQIVVFSLFFGSACAAVGEPASPVIAALDALSHITLKITSYVMHFAPVAVCAALTSIIAQKGLGVLLVYGRLIVDFYFGLLLLCALLAAAAALILGKRCLSLFRHIREPMLLAFATASSESAYPLLLRQLERYGCDAKICGLVLPLGYSFNLDGSMMYMTFAVLFISQAYGMQLPPHDQILMLLILLFTSKGMAGVPRASLVVIAGTLSMFHIPEAGLLLLLGIDQLLDMGRSAVNMFGNSMATAIICRSEQRGKQPGS